MVEVLVTVHGILSKGAWHRTVAEALEPHFKCIRIEYRGYRFLGPFVFAGIPIGALMVLAAIAALAKGVLLPDSLAFIGLAGCGIVMAIAGGFLPRRALHSVMNQIRDAKIGSAVPPHL